MNNDAVSRRRVVITGVGLITPLGHNVPDTWAAILAGRSGFGPLTLVDNPNHTIGGLCEVKNFDPAEYMDRKDARRRDRYQQLAVVAAAEAMRQANLSITDDNRERIGITIGTGVGGMRTIVDQEDVLREGGLRRLNPFGITMIMPNGAAGMLAIEYGITGPSTTITTACAAGNDAVGHAFRSVRYGEVDAILTGGTECIMTSIAIGGFERAGATSTRSSNAPQPFDANRDGLVIGEGLECWCWKVWSTPRLAGQTSWPRSSATARRPMRSTSPRRRTTVPGRRAPFARHWSIPGCGRKKWTM